MLSPDVDVLYYGLDIACLVPGHVLVDESVKALSMCGSTGQDVLAQL